MKIAHLFLVAVSLLLLASSGFALKAWSRRACYQANGSCTFFKCSYPLVKYGRCGLLKVCCVRIRDRENLDAHQITWDPLKQESSR
ncbi:gallinacin-1 alpha-like [Sceloporus undulatus]|uniref:gallinacin-1 alpha-like n=1 Tax=Sceloporus undulatus TaxID=8520 RepID=UPI001C4CB59A|nr:gallinacin-1 alpha-like [Sceloporus undulatus]